MAEAPNIPRRDELDAAARVALSPGGAEKADVLRVDGPFGRCVVKDVSRRPLWARVWGRWQLRREERAYRRLAGVAGVPALLGRVDADALAFEWIDGGELARDPARFREGRRRLAELTALVDALHARGVAHLDLRGRHNVLLRRGPGRVVLVDFAGSVALRPGSAAHRLLFPRLARVDRDALVKWKRLLFAGPLTREEWARVARAARRHRWWLPNPSFRASRRSRRRAPAGARNSRDGG